MKSWIFGAGVAALCGFACVSLTTLGSQASTTHLLRAKPDRQVIGEPEVIFPVSAASGIASLQDQALFVCLGNSHAHHNAVGAKAHQRLVAYQHLYSELRAFPVVQQALANMQVAERHCEGDALAAIEDLQGAMYLLDDAVRKQQAHPSM